MSSRRVEVVMEIVTRSRAEPAATPSARRMEEESEQ